jgi:uncharacterized protein
VWKENLDTPESVRVPPEATIEILKRRGYLTEKTVEQEAVLLEKAADVLHQTASRRLSYIFMPTYDCNLRCAYCFQDKMRTDPAFRPLLRTMSTELVDRIFKAMPTIEKLHGIESGRPTRRNIGFFGGEPLLAKNRPVIEHILERQRDNGGGTFWAVTNGTELSAYWDVLHPDAISELQITLDGPPAEHDRRRIRPSGKGTFSRIAGNIDRALRQGVTVSVRINLDRDNLAHLPALAAEMSHRGWVGQRGFSAYAAPITASEPNADRDRLFDSWQLNQALARMREEWPNVAIVGTSDDRLVSRVGRIFSGEADVDPLEFQSSSFCGAHTGMYIFDAFGDIYACWERTGDARVRIGHITDVGEVEFNRFLEMKWRSRTIAASKACTKCSYSLYCGGGCAVLAEAKNGGFFTNHCDGYSQRFRSAVAKAYINRFGDKLSEEMIDA